MFPEWTNMLSWPQWLLLAMVPPAIVALYFLKLKRVPLEVPSTYLWKKSIEDLHVNSLWQRLRRNLLLWLQLFLLLLIILALLNPSWRVARLTGNRFIFVIDNSASMNARDVVVDGETTSRLEAAKHRVAELIDAMKTGDAAMIISFSDEARVLQAFTTDARELHRGLAGLSASNRRTSLAGAMRLAAGLANPGRTGNPEDDDTAAADALPAEMFVLSDFRLPDVADFSLGNLDPTLEMIGDPDSVNIGIVNFSIRRHEQRADQIQALARLENCGSSPETVTLELFLDGESIDVQQVRVPGISDEQEGGNFKQVLFTLEDVESGTLKLVGDFQDALPLDDQAWAVINLPRRGRVLLVSPGDMSLERAFSTSKVQELADVRFAEPDVLATEDHRRQAQAGHFDLIIYDRCQPTELPRSNTLFLGKGPPGDRWKLTENISVPQIIDTERTHPLMNLLDLGDVDIVDSFRVEAPRGGTTLIESQNGPIFAIAPREGFEDAVMGFALQVNDADGNSYFNTNWPGRHSFPVFIQEAINYLVNREQNSASANVLPGRPFEFHLSDGPEHLEVTHPDGAKTTIRRNRQNRYMLTRTDDLGVYRLGDLASPFHLAVNMFDPLESDIRPQPRGAVRLGNVEVEVSARPNGSMGRYEAWKLLALLGLGTLMLEWYIYNRRVYV